MARLEINGFKVLLENSDHNNEEKTVVGHYWKGIDGLVTEWRARHEIPFEYVYVSDKVLAVYEADEDYEVHPLSGSVNYKNQWFPILSGKLNQIFKSFAELFH